MVCRIQPDRQIADKINQTAGDGDTAQMKLWLDSANDQLKQGCFPAADYREQYLTGPAKEMTVVRPGDPTQVKDKPYLEIPAIDGLLPAQQHT